MSRTKRRRPGWSYRKEPSFPWWPPDESYRVWPLESYVRGHCLPSPVREPKRGGGWAWDEVHKPESKRFYKRMARRMRRREAKAQLRSLDVEAD